MKRGTGNPEKLQVRFDASAFARMDMVADKLRIQRTEIVRALILEQIGLSSPVTTEIARMIRDVVAENCGESQAA